MSSLIAKDQMRLQTFDVSEYQLLLTTEEWVQVLSYLPMDEIVSKVSLVSKEFCNAARDAIVFMAAEHLEKNKCSLFSKVVDQIRLNQEPLTATIVVKAFRKGVTILRLLQDDQPIKVLDFTDIDRRMKEISTYSLNEHFSRFRGELGIKDSDVHTLKAIIDSGRFSEIPAQMRESLFLKAADNGLVDFMKAIIDSKQFSEIPAHVLEWAFSHAEDNNHVGILQAIIDSGRFSEISSITLCWAFVNASERGYVEILRAIIASKRFCEISTADLLRAFNNAIDRDDVAILQAIIDSERFYEISKIDLGHSFLEASAGNHVKTLQAIISSKRFFDICLSYLNEAFDQAVDKRCVGIEQAIRGSGRFSELHARAQSRP